MAGLVLVSTLALGAADPCLDSCPSETGHWDGDFGGLDFCSCNFGDACPYVCGGGGDGNDGGFCRQDPCSTGQYTFSDDGWSIHVTAAQAKSKAPYRAFAYLPFCGGSDMSCLDSDFSMAVSLKGHDICKAGAHVNVLFWTDPGTILSILPPGAPGVHTGTCRLLAFADNYPNQWIGEMPFEDNTWYDVKVSFSSKAVTVEVNGNLWTNGDFHGDLSSANGPQLGVYSFDFNGDWRGDSFSLTIGSVRGPGGSEERHACEYECLSGAEPSPSPVPPSPTPSRGPVRSPIPSGCSDGFLAALISMCPEQPAEVYKLCVDTCVERCQPMALV